MGSAPSPLSDSAGDDESDSSLSELRSKKGDKGDVTALPVDDDAVEAASEVKLDMVVDADDEAVEKVGEARDGVKVSFGGELRRLARLSGDEDGSRSVKVPMGPSNDGVRMRCSLTGLVGAVLRLPRRNGESSSPRPPNMDELASALKALGPPPIEKPRPSPVGSLDVTLAASNDGARAGAGAVVTLAFFFLGLELAVGGNAPTTGDVKALASPAAPPLRLSAEADEGTSSVRPSGFLGGDANVNACERFLVDAGGVRRPVDGACAFLIGDAPRTVGGCGAAADEGGPHCENDKWRASGRPWSTLDSDPVRAMRVDEAAAAAAGGAAEAARMRSASSVSAAAGLRRGLAGCEGEPAIDWSELVRCMRYDGRDDAERARGMPRVPSWAEGGKREVAAEEGGGTTMPSCEGWRNMLERLRGGSRVSASS